jgi:caa(3)-type oxidase subunit IV
MALFLASLAWAYRPLVSGLFAVNLAIAVLMIALLVTFLMDLRNAKALIRIVAAAGLFWCVFMFVLTFTDYLSRHY